MDYLVEYYKYYHDGNLKDILIKQESSFKTLEKACEFVGWTLKHAETKVKSIEGSCYTTHHATIITKGESNV